MRTVADGGNAPAANGVAPTVNGAAPVANGAAPVANGNPPVGGVVAAAGAPIRKFTGTENDDYIECAYASRPCCARRAFGTAQWPRKVATRKSKPRRLRAVTAALDVAPAEAVASAKSDVREMFRLLDDKYIPKRKKSTFAERFAANPAHFDNFKKNA